MPSLSPVKPGTLKCFWRRETGVKISLLKKSTAFDFFLYFLSVLIRIQLRGQNNKMDTNYLLLGLSLDSYDG